MTDTVTEAAVEAAATAIYDRLWRQPEIFSHKAAEQFARAALDAAAPLVVAGERERCAAIAESAVVINPNEPSEIWDVHNRTCRYIANAIRADNGGE